MWLAGTGAVISLFVWLIAVIGDRYIRGNFDSLVGIGETPQDRTVSKARREATGEPERKTATAEVPGRRILLVGGAFLIIAVVSAVLK